MASAAAPSVVAAPVAVGRLLRIHFKHYLCCVYIIKFADMKKLQTFFIVLIAIVGCQVTNPDYPVNDDKFYAEVDTFFGHAKTSMDDLRNVLWSENDQLAIFQGCSAADRYQVAKETVGTGNGVFEIVRNEGGELNGNFNSGVEVDANVAFYPFSDNLSLSISSVSAEEKATSYAIKGHVLPEIQSYVEGSFGEGTFPMVAVTETLVDHKLKFKNILGAIKLQLKGTVTVKTISIKGNQNEKLSGPITVIAYPDGVSPSFIISEPSREYTTLDCGSGIKLDDDEVTEFIISLPPVHFVKGFAITVTDTENSVYEIKTDVANSVLRSYILSMPSLTLGGKSVENITLDKTSIRLKHGASEFLTLEVSPSDASYRTISWYSSDESVVRVDNGIVTGVGVGEAMIIVEVDGYSAQCAVEVSIGGGEHESTREEDIF